MSTELSAIVTALAERSWDTEQRWVALFPYLEGAAARRGIPFDKGRLAPHFFASGLPYAKESHGHVLVSELLLPYIEWLLLSPTQRR